MLLVVYMWLQNLICGGGATGNDRVRMRNRRWRHRKRSRTEPEVMEVCYAHAQPVPKVNMIFPFHGGIMWPSLVKIRYKELKLLCENLCGYPPAARHPTPTTCHTQSNNMARLDTPHEESKSINDGKLIQTPHDHSQYINEGKPLMKWHNVHTAMRGHTHDIVKNML